MILTLFIGCASAPPAVTTDGISATWWLPNELFRALPSDVSWILILTFSCELMVVVVRVPLFNLSVFSFHLSKYFLPFSNKLPVQQHYRHWSFYCSFAGGNSNDFNVVPLSTDDGSTTFNGLVRAAILRACSGSFHSAIGFLTSGNERQAYFELLFATFNLTREFGLRSIQFQLHNRR